MTACLTSTLQRFHSPDRVWLNDAKAGFARSRACFASHRTFSMAADFADVTVTDATIFSCRHDQPQPRA